MKSLGKLLNNLKNWFDEKKGRNTKKKEKEEGKEEKGKKPIYIDKFIIQKKNELI